MILEGLVTTRTAIGEPHLAPMGPSLSDDHRHLVLRPFATSNTYQNLCRHPEGVFHTTDDVLLFAKSALGAATIPELMPATTIAGSIIADCCRYFEFRIVSTDTSLERITMHAEILSTGTRREWLGFNRAKHSVLEAAILATRFHLLPREQIRLDFERFQTIVQKTGGQSEHEAMAFLQSRFETFCQPPRSA